jgi:D,D-heptose 1,7-bisphosphate phosphatase
MTNHAVFFDRDGTINLDTGYIGNPGLVQLYNGVPEGISELKNIGFKIIVVSNQSGIARGIITKENVEAVNNKINELLKKQNTRIDAFYYCPFHPDFSSAEESECRKPSPKMIFKAAKDWNITLEKSYLVGDSSVDVECGINAGIKTILLKNTLKENEISDLQTQGKVPTYIADNFSDACKFIIKDYVGGN